MPKRPDPVTLAAMAGGVAYPAFAYAGLRLWDLPPWLLAAVALAVATLRTRKALLLAVPLAALAAADQLLAAKAYPVLVSLGFAAAFAWSLLNPPSLAERFARLKEPDLPEAGVRYCRRVSQVWLGFLLVNAAVATALALWGSLEAWALWTGVVAYVLMGLLFAAEFAIRKRGRA